jgi:hypothetical protein
MRRLRFLAAIIVTLSSCGSDAAVPASTTAATAGAASPTSQRLTFTTKDGTRIDYVLLVAPGRTVGQPGKVLFTFPPGGQDLDLTQQIVDQRWGAEALARGWVVVSPAAPSTGLFYSDPSARLVPERFRSLVVFPGYSEGGGDDPKLSVLKDIGVSMFVGGDDSGWLEPSRQTEHTLKGLGYTAELHVVPGEGHIIGSLTGADLFDAIERVRA